MEKEYVIKLKHIKDYLGIKEEDFIKIIALAKMHSAKSKVHINDEMLYEIIVESLLNTDHIEEDIKKDPFYSDEVVERGKTVEEAIMRAIKALDY